MVKRIVCWVPWLLLGCATKPVAAPPAAPTTSPVASAPISVNAAPPAPAAPGFRDCGELNCKEFPSAEAALAYVLAEEPRVLAVGEAHAQAAGPRAASSTKRFMDQLLPKLSPRASDLVIELWVANGSCGKVEQQVQKQQAEVTAPQAATNQNEFMELGHRAKALGIFPRALVPSCEQYQKIAGAGADDIAEMLTMIKSVTEHDVKELLQKRGAERLLVAYGGAIHNDLVPRPGREDFSFGPALAEATGGKYVELDLVIPEQVRPTEAWQNQPWYAPYAQEAAGTGAYLYSWAPHAYALLFPKAPPAPTEAPP
jgi:hypothetical protein